MKLLEEEKESRTAENRGGLWPSTKYQRRRPIPSLAGAKMHISLIKHNKLSQYVKILPMKRLSEKHHPRYTVHAAECVHQTVVD